MDVEWDEKKRLGNLIDHGVDFQDASLIFLSPVLEAEDRRIDYGETRYRALGQIDGKFLMVCYTWRGGARRIISAWKVDADGQRRYTQILTGGAEGQA